MSGRSTSSVRAALLTGVCTIMSLISGCGGGGGGSSGSPAPTGPPGALDPSFGNRGAVITPTGSNAYIDAVLVQSNGMIVVAGTSTPPGADFQMLVVRYTADRALDTGFGAGGFVRKAPFGMAQEAIGVAEQPDGKLVVLGAMTNESPGNALMRLAGNGAVDGTFGSAGVVSSFSVAGGGGQWSGIAIQPDGRILVAETEVSAGEIGVVRLEPDGSLDMSFGADGEALAPAPPAEIPGPRTVTAPAIALQPDGKIVVAAHFDQARGTLGDFVQVTAQIARFAANGAPDPGFGQGGQTTLSEMDEPGRRTPIALALQADGRMLLEVPGGVTRLLPNGAVDTAYGVGGTAPGIGGHLALQPNGKLVTAQTAVIGDSRTTFALSHYVTDGAVDTSFGSGGVSVIALGTDSLVGGVAIQPDGRIVVAGYEGPDQVSDSGAGSVVVARYFGDPASSTQR